MRRQSEAPAHTPPSGAAGGLKLSPIPDFASRPRLLAAAFAVWAIAVVTLVATRGPVLARDLGDTDDALRLTMVRDLFHGQGWYDQKLVRLQPPLGLYMHWSRLVDGGEAALMKLFGLILAPAQAEFAMRMTWPLLWILPAVVAVLLIARRLGDGRAVFMAAVAATLSFRASGEFVPGRIDHHNVQITCCLIALAAAVQEPALAWAVAAGLASALGLAVGLEAIVFHALIGAALALGWASGRLSARQLATYGASLAVGVVALFLIQTPPARWGLGACDALAVNLVAGLALAGFGVAATALIATKAAPALKVALQGAVGAASAGLYLALDPLCIHGPMAGIDPVLKAVWLDHVHEMQPWANLLITEPGAALGLAAPVLVGLASLGWLAWRRRAGPDPALLLAGAGLVVATILALIAVRSAQYAIWFSAPIAGAAAADAAGVALGGLMIPAVAAFVALGLAPIGLGALAASALARPGLPAGPLAAGDDCIASATLRSLAQAPPGLVLSEIDEGPYILANTPDAVLQAPYHRIGWGIRQARAALGAPPEAAEPLLRRLGVTYVVNCSAHSGHADRDSLRAGSLQSALDAGRPPVWLRPLAGGSRVLRIYAVR